ncbi:MAG: hypothetical protein LBQ82_00505 [Treponema sp.]|jgi:hypothetical protein|nr:hypothetical protein [Treponema sp.]
MKSRKLWTGILVILLVFGTILIGCSEEPEEPVEPTYTVWTDLTSYSEFYSVFGDLDDGYYIRLELTNSQFNEMSPSLTNEYKHIWTEDQLYNWFIGRGFGSTEANREKAWLISINHGFIASRSGSIVYMLIK